MLAGLAASVPAVTPVPARGMLSNGFDALLAIAMLPVTLPAPAGVNVAVKLALCPAWSTSGMVTPLRVNPVPLGVIDETIAAVAPPFVKVMVCAWGVPS
jgi:hypothetical protein